MLYGLTINSHKSFFSRYTAGYTSDNNKHRVCSKVNFDKNITLYNSQVCLNGIFCALVDSSQPGMPTLFEYSGSPAQHLTWMNFFCYAGAQGGTLNFSSYVGLGHASTFYPQKNNRNFKHPKKIFEILATPKKSPFCTMTLRKDFIMHRNNP